MVKSSYLFFAFLTFLVFVAILLAFTFEVDNGGPWDRGDTPSQVVSGAPGVEKPNKVPD
jgi:hypothetical protein